MQKIGTGRAIWRTIGEDMILWCDVRRDGHTLVWSHRRTGEVIKEARYTGGGSWSVIAGGFRYERTNGQVWNSLEEVMTGNYPAAHYMTDAERDAVLRSCRAAYARAHR